MSKKLKSYPKLLSDWNFDRNTNQNPENLSHGSMLRVWWKCNRCNEEWETTICNRTSNKRGCPYCTGRKAGISNCLATKYPKVADEWHVLKNGKLTPFDVVAQSNKKVWWNGKCGHEWEAVISSRVNDKGCPYCTGRKVCLENCLATKNPEIAKQWHVSKNNNLTPFDVTNSCNKKVWWKCDKGADHEWEASICNRTNKTQQRGCPCCSGKKVCLSNCLATLRPELVKEWHSVKNNNITPYDFVVFSHKIVWWKCSKNHEWSAAISSRTYMDANCPYCSNQKVCLDNCLMTTHPHLVNDWDYEKNGEFKPSDVVAGSDKKAWWKCKNGHSWFAQIKKRAIRNDNCARCNISKGETFIESILTTLNIKFVREQQFPKCKNIKLLKFDFCININNIPHLIEYQGEHHYQEVNYGKGKEYAQQQFKKCKIRDAIKRKFCKQNNIPLLRIPYWKTDEEIKNSIQKFLN